MTAMRTVLQWRRGLHWVYPLFCGMKRTNRRGQGAEGAAANMIREQLQQQVEHFPSQNREQAITGRPIQSSERSWTTLQLRINTSTPNCCRVSLHLSLARHKRISENNLCNFTRKIVRMSFIVGKLFFSVFQWKTALHIYEEEVSCSLCLRQYMCVFMLLALKQWRHTWCFGSIWRPFF